MAFSELEAALIEVKLEEFLKIRRPPEPIRDKLDLGFRLTGYTVDIFSIRPRYQEPSVKYEEPAARAVYVKVRNFWKIYWMRADMRWHRYPHVPEVSSFDEFIRIVLKDEFCCFWG